MFTHVYEHLAKSCVPRASENSPQIDKILGMFDGLEVCFISSVLHEKCVKILVPRASQNRPKIGRITEAFDGFLVHEFSVLFNAKTGNVNVRECLEPGTGRHRISGGIFGDI